MANKASLALGVAIMIISGYAIFTAMSWPSKAALFPLLIGVPVFCLAAIETLLSALRPSTAADEVVDVNLAGDLTEQEKGRRSAAAIGWILSFFAAILLLGFLVAVPLFVLVFVKMAGREGWVFSLIFSSVVAALFYLVFDRFLHLPFPAGFVAAWLGIA